MKNKKVVVFVIITSIILIGIICSFISVNRNIITEKQVIKEMSESTQVTDLNNQINALNVSHEQYAKNVQAYKEKIAEAITSQGVSTSAEAKAEVMAENIGKILQAKTTGTATAEDILSGKTAWVNGSKITGTMKVEQGQQVVYLGTETSFNLTSYENYNEFTTDNFIVCATDASYNFGDNWHSGYAYVRKNVSYNSSTGILSAYENIVWHYNHYTGDPARTGSGNYPVAVYLVY